MSIDLDRVGWLLLRRCIHDTKCQTGFPHRRTRRNDDQISILKAACDLAHRLQTTGNASNALVLIEVVVDPFKRLMR